MNKILLAIYTVLPKPIQHKLGQSVILKPLRDFLLKNKGIYKVSEVFINRQYLDFKSQFKFLSTIKNAAKAKKSGIENTLILNSFKLLKTYKDLSHEIIILDVGANFGFLSLVWATTVCRNSGQVIAFEPNKYVYKTFKKSIDSNNLTNKIELHNVAVGAENKMISIFLNNTTSNVLESNKVLSRQKVKMITLDNYFQKSQIKKCDLIKIDVDGIELDILEGCINVLKLYNPICIVETNGDNRIITFFQAIDYDILDMDLKPFKKENGLPPNIFCVPKTN